jgi:hypothetical protein
MPVVFTPSASAIQGGTGTAIKFRVTITNTTGTTYDPSMLMTTAQSGAEEAVEIFDGDSSLSGSPQTKLLTGRTVTFHVGCTVANAKDVALEIRPGFDYASAMFQS